MVKKLQALKAKKGFTLVELIVVIAIIGVLAAILIPTLSAQITKSKVTSSDTAAKELVGDVSGWLSEDITAGGVEVEEGTITIVVTNGTVAITNEPTAAANHHETLTERIESDYPASTFAANVFVNSDGKAFACVMCDGATAVDAGAPTASDFTTGTFTWKSAKKTGVTTGGAVVGTSPKLQHA